jgi:hypothetical protein
MGMGHRVIQLTEGCGVWVSEETVLKFCSERNVYLYLLVARLPPRTPWSACAQTRPADYCDRNPNLLRLLDFGELISIGSNLRLSVEAGTLRFVCLKPHV